ncbi:MAG: recombinase family protein [Deltaproteobacteria bacterium]|nr:recombinase family protein [Deltaproteobacteria bacterium]
MSLREIERRTGYAKSSIRDVLRSHGLVLRRAVRGRKRDLSAPDAMRPDVIPYGYCYLDGKLVVDTREHGFVLQMVRMWKSGKSFIAIADYLNSQKVPTRMDKRWYPATVRAAVERRLEGEKNED